MTEETLTLHLRRRALTRDPRQRHVWKSSTTLRRLQPSHCGLILCDVWDDHWSRGAVERLEEMLPAMERVVTAARNQGIHVIHAPSETMDFYAGHPARRRIQELPAVEPPPDREIPVPALPLDTTGGSSDTPEPDWHRAWSRQHPAITIDEERDVISDNGREIYAYLQHRRIQQLLILGVHTNMCILNRSFAIKQMVRWNVEIALVRDLTDTMYDPAKSPYVSHEEGTRLVIDYIEAFWCPTVESQDLLRPSAA